MKKKNLIYIILVLLLLLFPLIGMPLLGSEWSSETTALAEAPELKTEDGKLNTAYLSDAGKYFEDHFALRSDMITANSLLQAKLFNTSANSKITVGSDGWLYFNGDLNDYQGLAPMDDRELYNIAHNLKIMQDYYSLLGKNMLFTIAPNKSSLYPEHMPSNISRSKEEGNADRLIPYLEEQGIHYVNLFELFRSQDECLYFKEDSHWNNKGAVLVYNKLMEEAGYKDFETYASSEPVAEKIHRGDLAEMLYPEKVVPETDYVYPLKETWTYLASEKAAGDADTEETTDEDCLVTEEATEEASSEAEDADSDETAPVKGNDPEKNMESYLQTENPEGKGTLYMFRDSFGASMVPFFSQAFRDVTYNWEFPYNLTDAVVLQADTVILECVERKLDNIAEYGGTYPALPEFQLDDGYFTKEEAEGLTVEMNLEKNGSYFKISGKIEGENFLPETDLLIRITKEDGSFGGIYSPFYISETGDNSERISDNGFLVNLSGEELTGKLNVELLAEESDHWTVAGSKTFELTID